MTVSIHNEKYLSLRTYRKTGVPVDTPVWFASLGDRTLYVFSAGNAGKVKRLRNTARTQITRCDYKGGSLGDWVDCKAFLVDDAAEVKRAHEQLLTKYGWSMRITDMLSKLSGRLQRRAYIRIEM